MIPWETFKTPQDAYEWAKSEDRAQTEGPGRLFFVHYTAVWPGFIEVWVNRHGYLRKAFDNRVRR